jgi:hypothetical protein
LAVVVIDDDRQAGHADGMFAAFELDGAPMLLLKSNDLIRVSMRMPHNFSGSNFHLCSDRDLVAARHTRCTSAGELHGAKTGQHGEFERADVSWTLYHANHLFMTRLSQSETLEICPTAGVGHREHATDWTVGNTRAVACSVAPGSWLSAAAV